MKCYAMPFIKKKIKEGGGGAHIRAEKSVSQQLTSLVCNFVEINLFLKEGISLLIYIKIFLIKTFVMS